MDEPDIQALRVRTKFVKSNFARVIRVDGAWGGITPQSDIHMALFNERWALAEETEIKADETGAIKDFQIDPPGVIIREVEANVLLSEQAAKFLRAWLDEKIGDLERNRQPQAQESDDHDSEETA